MKLIFTLCLVILSGISLPFQQYQPNDSKSSVKFTIKNFGVNTGGSFKGLTGTLVFDKASPANSQFDISVDAATVNTDNDTRDSHLRKAEYFDTEKYPKITFKSEKITGKGDGYTVSGNLTIKAVTKQISFPFTARETDQGLLFEGSFSINRRDFKVGGNSMVLGDNVTVNLSVFGEKK